MGSRFLLAQSHSVLFSHPCLFFPSPFPGPAAQPPVISPASARSAVVRSWPAVQKILPRRSGVLRMSRSSSSCCCSRLHTRGTDAVPLCAFCVRSPLTCPGSLSRRSHTCSCRDRRSSGVRMSGTCRSSGSPTSFS